MFNFSDTLTIAGIIVSGLISIGTLTWWLAGQFTSLRAFVELKVNQVEQALSDKIEYHERHDDQRFNDLNNRLWELKLQSIVLDRTNGQEKHKTSTI